MGLDSSTKGDATLDLLLQRAPPSPEDGPAADAHHAGTTTARPVWEPSPASGQVREDEADYEDIFNMMSTSWPCSKRPLHSSEPKAGEDCEGSDCKRLRVNAKLLSQPAAQSKPFVPQHVPEQAADQVSQQATPLTEAASTNTGVLAQRDTDDVDSDVEKLPQAITTAFLVLGLPFSSSAHDVERRSRQLARSAHPDKVPAWLRPQAAREFRDLQEAKVRVLRWIRRRDSAEEDNDDSHPFEASSEEEGALVHDNKERVFGEGGDDVDSVGNSDSDECAENVKACGVAADGRPLLASPSSEKSGSSSGGEHEQGIQAAVRHAGCVRVHDDVPEQVRVLEGYLSATSALCQECFEVKVRKGEATCKQCQRQLRQLWQSLHR